MSYLSQGQDRRRRAGALAGTVAINATIGILVVTGLQFSGFVDKREYRPILEFPTPKPPPPPEPAPTPPPSAAQPYTAPLPPIPLPPTPGPSVVLADPAPLTDFPRVLPRADPGPAVLPTPSPAPNFTPRSARPSNNAASWISNDDYPRRSLLEQSEGTARYRLVVGTTGRVSSCEITASTGDSQLDAATCRFITRRARFEPATDESGAKVLGTYTGTVRWEIPD